MLNFVNYKRKGKYNQENEGLKEQILCHWMDLCSFVMFCWMNLFTQWQEVFIYLVYLILTHEEWSNDKE